MPTNKTKISVDWDKYAEQYDAVTMGGVNPAYKDLLSLIRRKIIFGESNDIYKNYLFADIGGGTGNLSLSLAPYFPKSTFLIIDKSSKMLEIAKRKAFNKGLENIDVMQEDVENIDSIVKKYDRPIDCAIMVHTLYATKSIDDPKKPERILSNIAHNLASDKSRFIIADVNQPLNTNSWIAYCLWNAYKKFGSVSETIKFFKDNDQSKLANRYIDSLQKSGDYLLCNLVEFENMLRKAGFNKIYFSSDKLYRGRDNTIIAGI